MNDYQSVASGQGLLKNNYDVSDAAKDSPMSEALASRRKKLADTKRITPSPVADQSNDKQL